MYMWLSAAGYYLRQVSPIIFGLGLLLAALLAARFLLAKQQGRPRKGSRPDRVTRAVELTALFAIITPALALIFVATPAKHLFELAEVRADRQAELVAAAIGLAACLLLAALLAAVWGRTAKAALLTILALGAFTGYVEGREEFGFFVPRFGASVGGVMVDGKKLEGSVFFRAYSKWNDIEFNVEGVEIWAGDIKLGETPFRTDLDTLNAQTGHLPEAEPSGGDSCDVYSYQPRRRQPESYDATGRLMFPTTFTPANVYILEAAHRGLAGRGREMRDEPRYVEGRAVYDGVPGCMSGSGLRNSRVFFEAYLNVYLPNLMEDLRHLLAFARLNDYHVADAWVAEIDELGPGVYYLLKRLAQDEPGLEEVRAQWLATTHGFSWPVTADDAWAFLERAMQEADAAKSYPAFDPRGESDTRLADAVALVAPALDLERLARLVERLIHGGGADGALIVVKRNGEFAFYGAPYAPDTWPSAVSPSTFVALHAVVAAEEALEVAGKDTTTIDERIVPAILRWHYKDGGALELVAILGGARAEHFYTRRYGSSTWRSEWWGTPHAPAGVNGWLYLLAHFDGEEGAYFRHNYERNVLEMAVTIANDHADPDNLTFLFLPVRGGDPLAKEFWPTYRNAVAESDLPDDVKNEVEYLVRLEPYPTLDMYEQAWLDVYAVQESRPDISVGQLTSYLDPLPRERRAEVLRLFLRLAEERLPLDAEPDPRDWRTELLLHYPDNLRDALLAAGDPDEIARLIEDMQGPDGVHIRENTAHWLADRQPEHPLVDILAHSEMPELRKVVLLAIERHPTAGHRALLDGLLDDPDEGVRQAAQAVQRELEWLARMFD